MIIRIINIIVGLLCLMSSLLLVSSVYAESTSDIYDKKVAKYAKVKQVVFRDDPTDVGGKAYDFAKASLGWLGIPGQALDVADFGRSVYNDGLTGANALTLVTKLAASKISVRQLDG